MALTNIFTGMEQGPEAIQGNFSNIDSRLVTGDTGWTTEGLTWANGFTSVDNFRYRRFTLLGVTYICFSGRINTIACDPWKTMDVFKIPTTLYTQGSHSFISTMAHWNSSSTAWFSFQESTGTITICNLGPDKSPAANLFWQPLIIY